MKCCMLRMKEGVIAIFSTSPSLSARYSHEGGLSDFPAWYPERSFHTSVVLPHTHHSMSVSKAKPPNLFRGPLHSRRWPGFIQSGQRYNVAEPGNLFQECRQQDEEVTCCGAAARCCSARTGWNHNLLSRSVPAW